MTFEFKPNKALEEWYAKQAEIATAILDAKLKAENEWIHTCLLAVAPDEIAADLENKNICQASRTWIGMHIQILHQPDGSVEFWFQDTLVSTLVFTYEDRSNTK